MIESSMSNEKSVLIIDDHVNAAEAFKSNLKLLKKNLNISILLSAEEAVLELKHSDFDLVISDIVLPGMSGFDLLKQIKKTSPQTKVFIVSGVADQGIKKEIAKAGADAFFYKPVDIAELLDAVERSLGFIGTILTPELHLEKDDPEDKKYPVLPAKLSALKKELNAEAVFLLGKVGQILASEGELPEGYFNSDFISRLFQLIQKREYISEELNELAPQNLHSFRVANYDILSVQFLSSYLLLIIIPKDQFANFSTIFNSTTKIYSNLKNLGVTTVLDSSILDGLSLKDEPKVTEPLNADRLLMQALDTDINLEDADSFWEELDSRKASIHKHTGTISYDQAK
ncbi:MAG: response regulator, partial [Candidatus Heimdallarchaeota archaeon]|nr:response regulator [Candidatus Heimdallarchaeota archaeon]